MLSFLLETLGSEHYAWLGSSRSESPDDERAGVLYDRRQVMLYEHDTKWLAPVGAPKFARGWDAHHPRTLEIAVFGLREHPGVTLRVLNTHFDHFGAEARRKSAEILAEVIRQGALAQPSCVQIVCGDFNSAKGESPGFYKHLISGSVGLRDAARSAPLASAMPPFTIHKFQGLAFDSDHGDGTVELSKPCHEDDNTADSRHIDWILWRSSLSCALEPLAYEVMTDTISADGRYPSDHFPVSFAFRLLPTNSASRL